jgi:acetyl-CoA synthetase (ADP-forming)
MHAPRPRISVERIIKPQSLAIIGASEDIAKFGGRFMHNVVRHGYAGTLLPINPGRETILGRRAYPNIAAAPGPVDLALVAVPAAQLRQTIEECGAAGVGACVVITAQLGEFDEAGAVLQDEIVKIAASHGMRLIGPNCLGMITPVYALALTSSPTLQYAEKLQRGSVGFVSQSGALMGALFVLGYDHGIGFSSMITVGNQADLELCDFFEALIADEETNVICLYVEALKTPPRFVELAQRAKTRGKRVLAVKAGRTEAGSAAARSHTASLAGSYAAFETICGETGILLMDEPEAMILVAGVLARAPRIGPGGIGMVVSSGGGGAITADRMTMAGLPLAQWTEETRARLDTHFPRTHQNNPVDLGAHFGALGPHIFKHAMDAVADDAGTAAFIYIMTPQPLMPQTVAAVIDIWRRGTKPAIFVLDTSRFGEEVRQTLLQTGMPYLTRIDDAIRVLELLVRERDLAASAARSAPARPQGAGPLPQNLPAGFLTEPEAKDLFRRYGIATTCEQMVQTAQDAVRAAEAIGYPVVAKGVSRNVVHKSDLGLVRLGLSDAAAVTRAFDGIASALSAAGETGAPTIAIQEMVRGEAELIVGARYDQGFGAQIMVGFGGVMVEVLRDIQLASAPLGRDRALALLRKLKLWPILDGVRSRPKLDVDAVADTLVRLSWLAHDLGPRLQDLEINPLIVRVAGQGAVAVDGRGTLSKPD